jgi:hypothetical protein
MLGGGVTTGRFYWRRWCVAYIEALRGNFILAAIEAKVSAEMDKSTGT